MDLPATEALYIDRDDIYFSKHRLIDLVTALVEGGGKYLFIDEVHRYGYGTWAQEIKQAYDLYRNRVKITFTGSSAIEILQQKADLSRRVLQYRVPGLSFREYLILAKGKDISVFSLEDLLRRHRGITEDLLTEDFRPLPLLRDYWREGYYPIFLDEPEGYASRLNTIVQLVLESDIPHIVTTGHADYQSLGRLLYAVASSAPFKPNVSKLAECLGIGRNTVLKYLGLLERAYLVSSLRQQSKGVASLAKPDKLYLNNPNLIYALAPGVEHLGTIRETFFLNQLQYLTHAPGPLSPEIRLPASGDFRFIDRDSEYLFEVGGPEKTLRQIGAGEGHYAVADTEATGSEDRVPLWLFGFLY